MSKVEPRFGVPLVALLAATLPVALACSEVTIVATGGGGQGSGAAPTGAAPAGGDGNPPPVVPCEQREEADCVGACVALVDWAPLVPGAPPPPPDVNIEAEPCCPECAQEQCNGCHMPVFKRCIPLDQCAEPQPPEDCGVPLSCDD